MSMIRLTSACNIVTGKLDSNAAIPDGKYPYFTCAPEPLRIDTYSFDTDAILLAGNNANGNFHCQRFNGKFNAYQRTYVITAKEGYDIDYIFYSLLINLQHLRRISQGSQTKFLTMSILDAFDLVNMEYEEQKRLVACLKSIDEKRKQNSSICADLEAMSKLLYDYWFVQFDFPDENGKPYKSSGGKMVWNEELKREIPEGWIVGNLYCIADFVNGLACQNFRPKDEQHKLPVIKIAEMHNGFGDEVEWARDDVPEKNIIENGDILFSWSATLETMIWNMGKGVLNQHIFKVIPKKYNKHYVYQQLSKYIVNFVRMAEARKTTMGHITTDHLKKSRIVLPPIETTEMFGQTVSPLFEKYLQCSEESQQLSDLRDFLLPMLMNGQVKVITH